MLCLPRSHGQGTVEGRLGCVAPTDKCHSPLPSNMVLWILSEHPLNHVRASAWMTGSSDATPGYSSQEQALGTQSGQRTTSRVDPAPSTFNPCFLVDLSRAFQPGSKQAIQYPYRSPACLGQRAYSNVNFFSFCKLGGLVATEPLEP